MLVDGPAVPRGGAGCSSRTARSEPASSPPRTPGTARPQAPRSLRRSLASRPVLRATTRRPSRRALRPCRERRVHQTLVSHSGCDVSLPRTTSKKRSCRRRVIGPTTPSPMGRSSTSRIGVTSAAVPVRNASSASQQLVARDAPLVNRDPLLARELEDRVARDALEDRAREVRRVEDALLHDEEVLARALRRRTRSCRAGSPRRIRRASLRAWRGRCSCTAPSSWPSRG